MTDCNSRPVVFGEVFQIFMSFATVVSVVFESSSSSSSAAELNVCVPLSVNNSFFIFKALAARSREYK